MKRGKLAIHGGPRTVPEGLKKRWPEITEEDKAAVMAVLDRGILTGVHGPEVRALEADWAAFTGSKYVLTFNSGTAALHAALFAAGVGPGDEVITSAFSFSGTFHAILAQNAIPIFVDIDPRTYNIDVSQIEDKITEKTKAILPVHIHGLPADMDEIMALAKKYNLVVIEDACQAHGSTYKGRMAGTIGDMGAFSLNVTKNLPAGEGGLLNTDNEAFAERAKLLRTFGERIGKEKEEIRPYYTYTIGWNYRMQELPAAFARSQLKRLNHYNAIAQRNGSYLNRELAKIPGIIPPYVPDDRTTVYHKYRFRFDPDALGVKVPAATLRDKLLAALKAEGVAVTIWHYTPLPSFPIFRSLEGYGKGCPWSCPFYGKNIRYDPADYPEANRLLETSLVLNDEAHPIYIQDLELMEYYVEAIRKVIENLDELLMD
ncbi:MAG: DegT/DnrJ/EryC1/StrS family aminotransferase [Chloroflexi bacterium]|nr:MAG: DegT/DnrJ/EryC1/StrS family aminotransferase [Chloroflexota bacterium]HDN80403.1 DegT/DnrJ/EryC1/StrS family aminotransferase [Chloroflexota bacterium]